MARQKRQGKRERQQIKIALTSHNIPAITNNTQWWARHAGRVCQNAKFEYHESKHKEVIREALFK